MEVRRDSVPLKSRRIRFCRIEDLIPGGYILHPLLHVSGHLANYAVVLVHGVTSASNQGLGYLLRHLGHLEDGRKARERDQGGGELEVLINLQMTLSEVGKTAPLHLRQPTPELPATGALGLLSIDQKLQNRRFHVWFLLDVIVDVAQRVVDVRAIRTVFNSGFWFSNSFGLWCGLYLGSWRRSLGLCLGRPTAFLWRGSRGWLGGRGWCLGVRSWLEGRG